MNPKNKFFAFAPALVFVCLTILCSDSYGLDKIESADIVEKTMACGNDCIDWKLRGVCFWLKCVFIKCSVKESPKVSHYIPDLLVSAYTTDSPLKDIEGVNSNTHNANLTQDHRDDQAYDGPLDYKHAEVVGNPTVVIFNELYDSEDYFCHSLVDIPYFPYFMSGLDKYWRNPSLEHFYPQAILGLPKLKTNWPLGYWAPVYPRCGWGAHPFDAINAAVAAHRVSSIVTGSLSPHIYFPMGRDCKNKCWPPKQIEEGKLSTHKFQMVFPKAATSGMVMGGPSTWANGKNKKLSEGYAWSLWRPYTCCHKKGQVFLYSIDW